MPSKPGQNTGKNGGVFQEIGPKGGKLPNYTTVADNKPLPPTSKSGNQWQQIVKTPNSKR